MMRALLVITSIFYLSGPVFAQKDSVTDLSRIFARNYLFGGIGLNSSTTKMVATDDSPYGAKNPTLFSNNFRFGYGRRLCHNVYGELNIEVARYKNIFFLRRPVTDQTAPYGWQMGLDTYDWAFELKGLYYYPLIKNRLYLSGAFGLKMTKIRKSLGEEWLYWPKNTYYRAWNKNQYALGPDIVLGLNFRLGKRILIFGQYGFYYLVTNDAFFHYRIEFYGIANNLQRYYETKVAPYSQHIELGLKISLENSLFYKKR
jgi:hypothetical protein